MEYCFLLCVMCYSFIKNLQLHSKCSTIRVTLCIITLCTGKDRTEQKSVDPDQMLQNAAFDRVLHCLPLVKWSCSDNIFFFFFFSPRKSDLTHIMWTLGGCLIFSEKLQKSSIVVCCYCDWHFKAYRNNPHYWDREAWANSVNPNQMLQNDQDLHCLPLIQEFLNTLKGIVKWTFSNFRTSMIRKWVSQYFG